MRTSESRRGGVTIVSGGVSYGGSDGEDSVVGSVFGCQVVEDTKGSGGHQSCPACVDTSLGGCVKFVVWSR